MEIITEFRIYGNWLKSVTPFLHRNRIFCQVYLVLIKLWIEPVYVLVRPCKYILVFPKDIGQLFFEIRIQLFGHQDVAWFLCRSQIQLLKIGCSDSLGYRQLPFQGFSGLAEFYNRRISIDRILIWLRFLYYIDLVQRL
jgi:hypothetical protein